MDNSSIKNIKKLGFQWETSDPFLFCAHHLDHYPKGNELMGPVASLAGRDLGQDFTIKDGWRMYHGEVVPGFPAHPHRGFETVTIVLDGFVDHSDSKGGAGRYGNGDVQWLTAGAGIQHSEMFPLLNRDRENPAELFQIWLNLPKSRKFAPPYYSMFWAEEIPIYSEKDAFGKQTEVKVIAGRVGEVAALAPAPDSWANDAENEVGIWLIKMDSGAEWIIPTASPEVKRTLYFYIGSEVEIDDMKLKPNHSAELLADQSISIRNGREEAYFLLLQGKPINEPVVQYGPFVMNTDEEIRQTMSDYRATEFGGWPWPTHDNVHPRDRGRFAKYTDGREEIR